MSSNPDLKALPVAVDDVGVRFATPGGDLEALAGLHA